MTTAKERITPAMIDTWSSAELTMPQARVLILVAGHGRIDSPTVGRQLRMLPSTLTRVVDKLVERNLVRRVTDASDRRVVHLEATERGQDLVLRLLGGA